MGVSWLVLLKMVRISKGLPDHLDRRLHRLALRQSRLLASMVTLVAVIGIVPYIALQAQSGLQRVRLADRRASGLQRRWYRDTALYGAGAGCISR